MTATFPVGDELFLDMIATTLAPNLRKQPWATPGEMAVALDAARSRPPRSDSSMNASPL